LHFRFRSCALIVAVSFTGWADAAGLEISFYGPPPVLPPGKHLSVVSGVDPGIPVVFDLSEADRVILRPATEGELPTEAQPVFRFEWREGKSARFYRLLPAAQLAELSAANVRDTDSVDGKNYELKALQRYLHQGKILRTCLPPSKPFRGSLTVFIVIDSNGKLDNAFVQPEGSVAECVLEHARGTTFQTPPGARQFTAKAAIRITE